MSPTARRGWKRRSEARPAELRAAALRLFATHGYGGTTIEEIAAAGKVTVGTIYRYFRDKEAILHEIVRWAAAEAPVLLSPPEPARATREDAVQEIRRLLERLWVAFRQEPHVHLLRLLVAESGNQPQLIERYRAAVLDPIEQAVARALQPAGHPEDAMLLARGTVGAVLGASLLAGSPVAPTPLVPQLAPRETLERFLRGLAVGAAPPPPVPPRSPAPSRESSRPRTPDSW